MKRFFRRIPLPAKLALIVFIPLVFVIILFLGLNQEKTTKIRLLKSFIDGIHESVDITNLIDNLQTERNLSYAYVQSGEKKQDLVFQRIKTDSIINLIASSPYLSDFRSYTFLENLDSNRSRIDRRVQQANQATHYFTTIIFRLNTLNPVPPGARIYLREGYADIVSQKLLSEMITYLSITCTNVYTALHTRLYMVETLLGTMGTQDIFKSYEKEFLLKASPGPISAYRRMRVEQPLGETISYLDTLFKRFKFDSSYTATAWRATYSAGLDQLRAMQQDLLSKVSNDMNDYYKKEQAARKRSLLFLVLSFVLALIVVTYVIYSISKVLTELRKDAERIARGAPVLRKEPLAKDVIGKLAISIDKIDESNKEVARSAAAIGKGEFDVTIPVRGEEDILGNALVEMKKGLQQLTSAEKDIANLAAIVHSSHDAIISKTLDGIVTSWNPGAERLFGYSAAEMIGQSITRLILPEDLDEEKMILERIRKGERVEHMETIRRHKSGKLVDISLTISPLKNSKGKIIGASKIARDITENVIAQKKQQLAEYALKESEQRLTIAIEATEMGTWELNLLTGQPFYSEQYLRMLGFDPKDTPRHEEIKTRIHPDDMKYRNEQIEKALATGMLDMEMRIQPNPDTVRWIRSNGRVFYDEDRKPVRMLGTTLDITDQKQAFKALQDREEKFKIIANTVPVMIWMSGNDRFADFFNTSWLDFTGRTIAEESGEGWLEGVYPDDVKLCVDTYKDSFAKQKAFSIEYRLRRHDGVYRLISDNAEPRFTSDGSFIGFISACRDVDDEKRISEKILQSELLFKTITNVSPVGLWMTDIKGRNNFVNDTWIEWTGISQELQHDVGWFDAVIPADREEVNELFQSAFRNRENFIAEFRIIRKDGMKRWVLSEGSPYYDIDGYFAGYAGSVTDITERKEDEIRKNEFLAIASHELKTPLTSVKAYSQLLSQTYKEANDVFLSNALGKVDSQVNKMTKLVGDFLNLSKIESDKFQLQREHFDISQLVKDIATDIQLVSLGHSIILDNTAAARVEADKEKIAQVVTNLLNNAVKYSPGEKNITVSVACENGSVKVTISDRGIGIKPEEQEKIFERFYRSRFNNNISFSGFGIGLYISAEIIRRHNGTIGVESDYGKGASFYFTLPLAG